MNVETLIKKLNEMPKNLQVVMPDMIPITKAVKADYGNGVVVITDAEEMTVEEFKEGLEKFFGTENYHQLTTFPVYATDGVEYFCRNANANWLFSDMSAFAMGNPDKHFIVAIATVKDEKCDVVYDDGNYNVLFTQHYEYTDLYEGEWKFFISNYANEKVIMLPSEY